MPVFLFSFLTLLCALVMPSVQGNHVQAQLCVTDCVQTKNVVVKLFVVSSSTPFAPPYIVLNGGNPINLLVGDSYFELGAMATDTEGDDLSGSVVITGGPVNTAIVSTTTLVYTVTDPYNSLSASTTRTVIVSPVPPVSTSTPPSTPPPSGGGGGSVGNPTGSNLSVNNLHVTTGTSTVTIQWTTNVSTISTFAWGTDPDATTGSVSEISPSTIHSIFLQDLTPATTYFIILHAYTGSGLSNYFMSSFTTMPLGSMVPPANVTNLLVAASAAGASPVGVVVSWTNPTSRNFSSVIVTRGTRFFPRDPGEGYIVYQGAGERVVDTNINLLTTYYYSVFTKNADGNYSSGAAVRYTPVVNGGTKGTASSSSSLFGGVVTPLATSSIEHVLFIQQKETISPIPGGALPITEGQSLLVDVPPRFISSDTEEILLEIDNHFFIFKKLSNGWYQTVVPSAFTYNSSSTVFGIHFLSVGSEYHLTGTFLVSKAPTTGGESVVQQVKKIVTSEWVRVPVILIIFVIVLIVIFRRFLML